MITMTTLSDRARTLRKEMTIAERHLWRAIRREALGCKFRRQHPIGPYILDFVSLEHNLVIEVDGGQHFENERDIRRDAYLRNLGFRVRRFWNNEVLANRDAVLEQLQLELNEA